MSSNFQHCDGGSDCPNLIGLFLGLANEFTRLRLGGGAFQKSCPFWIWKAAFLRVHELASSSCCSPTDKDLFPLGFVDLRLARVIDCWLRQFWGTYCARRRRCLECGSLCDDWMNLLNFSWPSNLPSFWSGIPKKCSQSPRNCCSSRTATSHDCSRCSRSVRRDSQIDSNLLRVVNLHLRLDLNLFGLNYLRHQLYDPPKIPCRSVVWPKRHGVLIPCQSGQCQILSSPCVVGGCVSHWHAKDVSLRMYSSCSTFGWDRWPRRLSCDLHSFSSLPHFTATTHYSDCCYYCCSLKCFGLIGCLSATIGRIDDELAERAW